jgi:hypothetical protein
MTEREWLTCTDPAPLLDSLRGKVSERKWRLLACACCRRVWHLLRDPRHRAAIAAAEQFADGQISPDEMVAIADDSYRASFIGPGGRYIHKGGAAHLLVRHFSSFDDWDETYRCPPLDNTAMAAKMVAERLRAKERSVQAALVRDIFGNPLRPAAGDPGWRTPDVLALAQTAYDERQLPRGSLDNDRLGVLADALEDAGCQDSAILTHLRSPGPHVRGCWPVDAILGKS